ncbi:MAG: hypothetical protein ACI4MI_03905 [Christensenellales bacterium]
MENNLASKKFLVLLLTFAIIISCAFMLSACNDDPDPIELPQLQSITARYKNDSIDFSSGSVDIPYHDGIQFLSADFKITLNYDDSSTQEITSGFTYRVYKIENNNEIETTTFEIGEYKFHFEYEDLSFDCYVAIKAAELLSNDIVCNLNDSYPFDPNGQITPDFTLTYGNVTLEEGVDYTVTYGENNVVGEDTGYVCINFIGIYQGEIYYYFDITAIETGEVVFKNVTTTYDGNYKWSLCEIDFSSIEGIKNIYYTFYDNLDNSVSPIDAGSYRVVAQIEVKDGYQAIEDKEFTLTINQVDISEFDLSDYDLDNISKSFKNQAYTSQDFEYDISQSLQDVTFDICMSTGSNIDNLNASTETKHGQIEVTGTGNYKGSLIIPFTISPYDVQYLYVELNDNSYYVYNGSQKTISKVQAYFDNQWVDIEQGEDKDYTISYKDNVNSGEASYKIVGYGNFTGEYNDTFYIYKATIDIDSNDYQFVNTTSTYNGENQFATLTTFNEDLPDQVEAIFTTGNYFGMSSALSLDELQNAGTYDVYVTFALKTEFENNYDLFGNKTFNESITINPVVVTSATYDSAFDGGEGTYENKYYYVYSGNQYAPKVVVTATLNGQPYTLVENQDYTISYYSTSTGLSATPLNADGYGVNINYGSNGSGNFAYQCYDDVYDYQDKSLLFNVNKKTIDDSQVTWPTTYRIVWGSLAYLDTTDFTTTKTQTITIEGNLVEATFDLKTSELYGYYDTYVDSNDQIGIQFTSQNYHVTDHTSMVQIVSLFDEFKLNGTALSAEQIDDLTQFNLDDSVEITFSKSYTIKYDNNTANYDEKYFDSDSGFSKVMGRDTIEEEYCNENYAYLTVYTADGETSIVGRNFTIVRE